MFKRVHSLLDFNNHTKYKFPHCTKTFWVHQEMIDEIVAWAKATEIKGMYLAENELSTFRKGDVTCAFAFKTEAELGIFNLTFFSKIIEDQKTTRIYRLVMMVEQLDQTVK